MLNRIVNYVDAGKIKELMEYFYHLTGISNRIEDLGRNILISVGLEAQAGHEDEEKKRIRVQNEVACDLEVDKGSFYTYTHLNGVKEVFIPIYIGEIRIGNLIFGQFFVEGPDKKDIIKGVPVISKEKFHLYVNFSMSLAAMASKLILTTHKMKEKEEKLEKCNTQLQKLVRERTRELEERNEELKVINKELEIKNVKMHDYIQLRADMEEKIKEEEKKYRSLLEVLPYGVCVRKDQKIVYANDTAAKILSFKSGKEMIYKHMTELFLPHPKMKKSFEEKLKMSSYQKSTPLEEEMIISKVTGKTLHVETLTAAIDFENENATLVAFRDITDKKELENRNRQLHESLNYERIKTEFFSNISHEFRTPINIIYNATKMCNLILNKRKKEAEERKLTSYFHMIHQNCLRLIKLVNNILDISKFDSGNMTIHKGKYNIIEIVEDTVSSIVGHVKSKNIEITFDTEQEEVTTLCDARKIERVLLNILSNAVKFTAAHGKILVKVFSCQGEVAVSVKDTGEGIPPNKIPVIFDKFVQVDKSFTRKQEGSGLGLYITKLLIEMHGGEIKAKSVLGEGSEFIFKLPIIAAEDEVESFDSSEEMCNMEFADINFSA